MAGTPKKRDKKAEELADAVTEDDLEAVFGALHPERADTVALMPATPKAARWMKEQIGGGGVLYDTFCRLATRAGSVLNLETVDQLMPVVFRTAMAQGDMRTCQQLLGKSVDANLRMTELEDHKRHANDNNLYETMMALNRFLELAAQYRVIVDAVPMTTAIDVPVQHVL